MENRKHLKFFLILVLLKTISLTVPGRVFGYEIQTHAGITKEAVEFYNQHFPGRPITITETKNLIEGAIAEDDAPRWLNHYYDPINNRGLTNPILKGEGRWLSSKAWARSGATQITELYNPIMMTTAGKLAFLTNPEQITASDYTWERALKDYVSGDVTRAFVGLGHIVHLIEDASVPDHTRNDIHIAIEGVGGLFGQGSPYELWTNQFNEENTELNYLLYDKKPIKLGTLDEYFDSMALYSNKNFYSKDTIDSPEYLEPKPDYIAQINGFKYGFKKDRENGDYRLITYQKPDRDYNILEFAEIPTLEDENDSIMRDYWERLAPKAVQHAAGVMDLFFREAEKLKNDPSFAIEKKKSFLSQVIDALRGFFEEQTNGGFETVAEIKLDGRDFNVKNDFRDSSAGPQNDEKIPRPAATPFKKGGIEIAASQKSLTASGPLPLKKGEKEPNFDYPEGRMKQGSPSTSSGNNNLAFGVNIATSTATPLRTDASDGQVSKPVVAAAQICEYGSPSTSSGDKKIIINEVAWAGTEQSASDEWIELRNVSGATISLDGYQLIDKGDQIHATIPPGTNLAPGAYFLLERTNDETVPNVPADLIYVGALGNDDEGLRLFDNNCLLLDEAIANPDWPAGSSNPRRTMERQSDMTWRTYSGSGEGGIFGTPRAANTESSAMAGGSGSSIQGSSSTGSETIISMPPPPAELATHIVISEVSAGIEGNTEYEFVELYNPTEAEVNLAGWSLKKKSSSGATTTLVSAGAFSGTIAPKSFFLIAHPKYMGAKTADLKYSAASQNLAYTNNAAVLYDAGGVKVDEVNWVEIEKGQSLERKAVGSPSTGSGNSCVSAQGDGLYLGNGCDTDSTADFETRTMPDPQNKNSLPEPRGKPQAASDFDARFYPEFLKGRLTWATTTDATGSTTQTYIIEGIASTTLVSYEIAYNELGRDFSYSISARDRDGLESDKVTVSTTTKSFIKEAKFYDNPINAGEKIIDLYFDKYPFVADPLNTGATWKLLVLGRNSAPPQTDRLDTPLNWEPENKEGVMKLIYRNGANDILRRYSLILPDAADRDFGGGVANSAYRYSYIDGKNLLRFRVENSSALTAADYFQISFYDFWGGGAGNQTFKFIFSDATRFYFAGVNNNQLPTSPGAPRIQSFATSTNQLFASWIRSSDPDGPNEFLEYQFNLATATSSPPEPVFDESTWKKPWLGAVDGSPDRVQTYAEVERGNYYIFGLRAIDELGATSTISTTEPYLVPIAEP